MLTASDVTASWTPLSGPQATPEPASLLLFGTGLAVLGLLGMGYRRKHMAC
ncbi:MAG: PEP-CTERM sorting domain-containing protein [Terriglobia bacterium]